MRILWIPHTSWHIPQRAHLFCRALAEAHEVHVTDWVADFVSPRDYLSRRYLRNFTYRCYLDGQIRVHGIPRFSPALFVRSLRRFNASLFSRFVKRIIEQERIDAVVGTFVVPPPRAPRLVFDLFDDNVSYWRARGRVPQYAEEIASTERAYLKTADAVVAVSSVLVDMAHELGARGEVHHIPNGVDLSVFAHASGDQVRNRLGIEGKLIGMVGNQDKLAELEKVLQAAESLKSLDITFLIAGRGAAMPAARRRVELQGPSNVLFGDYVPFDEAPMVISGLDVGLCPYSWTPGADAASPMRLLMYAAAGIPTVCTRLEEVRRMAFANVVLVDDTAQSLAAGIHCALQLPKGRPAQIKAYDLTHLVKRYEAVLHG